MPPTTLDANKKGVLFVTYSTSIGQSRGHAFEEGTSRVDQIVEWAGGEAFNGAWLYSLAWGLHYMARRMEKRMNKPCRTNW